MALPQGLTPTFDCAETVEEASCYDRALKRPCWQIQLPDYTVLPREYRNLHSARRAARREMARRKAE